MNEISNIKDATDMLVDLVKRDTQHPDAKVWVQQSRQVDVVDDGKGGSRLAKGRGRRLMIMVEVPDSHTRAEDTVTVEKMTSQVWFKIPWMEMAPGDIVRFRNADGSLQRDYGFQDKDGRKFSEVRDWLVKAPPVARQSPSEPPVVQVEPRDFDLMSEAHGFTCWPRSAFVVDQKLGAP